MSTKVKESVLSQFVAITGTSKEVAKTLLEACNGNLDMAIGMHMDEGDAGPSNQPVAAAAAEKEEVRAPIPQTNEVLVQEQPTYGFRAKKRKAKSSVFDGFRDFQAEARQQELIQQSMGASASAITKKTKTLEELYRPPIDILHKGSFQSARDAGCSSSRWLMVNVQNVQEFPCQVLNRDVWSNASVRAIIRDKFILWQVYQDADEGEKYTQFYPVNHWPYVAIIDPRTGEKMAEWHKLDAMVFCDLVGSFLSASPFPGSSTSSSTSSPPCKKVNKRDSIIDHSEDSQMQAAIQASMTETKAPKVSVNESLVFDTDSDIQDDSDDLETFSDSEEEEERSKSKSKLTNSSKSPVKSPKKVHFKTDNESNGTTLLNGVISQEKETSGTKCEDSAGAHTSQKEQWKQYLGSEQDEKTCILLRFPGGQRQQLTIPRSSQLRALTEYMIESGYSQLKHELLTNFPKRNLSSMDQDTTLESLGLFPQETVFVHETEGES